MAMIVKEILIDCTKPERFRTTTAKQGDINSRFVKATITTDGTPITIENDCIVLINAKRSDEQIKSFKGRVEDDGSILVPITNWMLEIEGHLGCEIVIVNPTTQEKLSTTKFTIEVEAYVSDGSVLAEDDNYDFLLELITQVDTAVKSCNSAIEEAKEAVKKMVTDENLKTVGGESLLGAGNIDLLKRSDIINDETSSGESTYSSNKINSLVSVFKNTLNIQIVSTEDEFADFLENMNTHTLYLINNAIFGHEYYDADCYVEIIVTQVGENFQYELVGSTAVTLGVVESYTYSKEELDSLGVRNIPSPLYVNNTLLNDVYGVPTRQRSVLFVDENYELMPITVRDNLVRVHFPITIGKEYSEKLKIVTYDAYELYIHLKNNNEYRCYKALKELNLTIDEIPATEEAFECALVFSVADTIGSFVFTAPDNISWIGDDCEDNVFTPQEGSNYEINIKWLGNIGGAKRLIARVGTF